MCDNQQNEFVMDIQFLSEPWLWWFILGVALFFLELAMPGFIVLFFGIGCLVTSAVLLAVDLSLTWQVVLFIVASLASILLLRKYFIRVFAGQTDEASNDLDDFPANAQAVVVKAIQPPRRGRIQHRGSLWAAEADEPVAAGETVTLVEYADSAKLTFRVRKA